MRNVRLIDIRKAILAALKKELLLDLEDQLRAAALEASRAGAALPMNAKRRREAEGQIRFRLQEERYEEVVQQHGGHLLPDGVMWGTDLKVFQPFARFPGPETAIILGFASMSEPRKIPPKNQSRAAGVTLNVSLQASLFDGNDCPKATDIFVLFLTARDRRQAGMIEEIAIGVIGADYKDFIFYASLDDFIQGYESEPARPGGPDGTDGGAKVKLRPTRKRFMPPEQHPDTEVGEA